jgi:hypothetical protein
MGVADATIINKELEYAVHVRQLESRLEVAVCNRTEK